MGGRRTIETAYGRMTVFDDDLISRHLARFGKWAPYETMFADILLSPGQTVIDGGSSLVHLAFRF